jgi:hypothetical protein
MMLLNRWCKREIMLLKGRTKEERNWSVERREMVLLKAEGKGDYGWRRVCWGGRWGQSSRTTKIKMSGVLSLSLNAHDETVEKSSEFISKWE